MPNGDQIPCNLWLKGILRKEVAPDLKVVFFKAFFFRKVIYFQIHSDKLPHLNEQAWIKKQEFIDLIEPIKIQVPKSIDRSGKIYDAANNQDYLNAVTALGQPRVV